MAKEKRLVELVGKVVPFTGMGRKLGYPTANIRTSTDLADGIYFGYADLGEYQNNPCLIFIGVPLTVDDKQRRLEAHLLDIPDKDYYGQVLYVRSMYYHRPNQAFDSIEQLMEMIHADEAAARQWFKHQGNA